MVPGSFAFDEVCAGSGSASGESVPPASVSVSVLVMGALLVAGVVALFLPVATELAVAMIIMSVFVVLRVVIFVDTVILSMQRRDVVRSASYAIVVVIKLGLVAALVAFGAIGAAIATVVADVILLTVFTYYLNRPPASVTNAPAVGDETKTRGPQP